MSALLESSRNSEALKREGQPFSREEYREQVGNNRAIDEGLQIIGAEAATTNRTRSELRPVPFLHGTVKPEAPATATRKPKP